MRIVHFVVLLALGVASPAVFACTVIAPGPFYLAPTGDDTLAPETPDTVEVEGLRRGRAPGETTTSCDDIGLFTLVFPAAGDNGAPPFGPDGIQEGVGYLLRLVDGDLPDGLVLPGGPTQAFLDDEGRARIPLAWVDGAEDAQEPFDAVIGVRAIDRDGNVGDEVTVEVADPGRTVPPRPPPARPGVPGRG